jgi:hypothetical protein
MSTECRALPKLPVCRHDKSGSDSANRGLQRRIDSVGLQDFRGNAIALIVRVAVHVAEGLIRDVWA